MVKELFTFRKWTRDGSTFYHRQVFNNGEYYVYEVDHDDDFKYSWYEVFKRKVIADLKKVNGKLVRSETDFHVKYPSNEDFGHWAWNLPHDSNWKTFIEDRI